MFRIGSIVTMAALAVLPGFGAAADEFVDAAAKPVISGALALSGSVKANSQSATIPNLLPAIARLSTPKTVTKTVPSYSATLRLAFGTELVLTTDKILDKAVYSIPAKGELVSTGESSIAGLSSEVKAPTGGVLVSVTAKSIASTAKFSKLAGKKAEAAATAKISELVVDLSGLGYGVHKFSGAPKPNTKLYASSDGSVVIYLDRESDNLAVPADTAAPATLKSVDADAVDVVLTDVDASGFTVSGTLKLGTSFASDN